MATIVRYFFPPKATLSVPPQAELYYTVCDTIAEMNGLPFKSEGCLAYNKQEHRLYF